MLRFLILLSAAIALPAQLPAQGSDPASEGWKLLHEKDGVRSYRRTPEDSKLHEFRGEGEVPVNAYKVLAVIRDTDRAVEWVADMIEGRSLGYRAPYRELVYTHFNLPWPMKDRDFLYEEGLTWDEPGKTFTVTMRSTVDTKMPEREGVIRGELLFSEYTVTWLDENRSWVTVRVHTDPKGTIPTGIVNAVTKNWPWETISRLRNQAINASGYEALAQQMREEFPLE